MASAWAARRAAFAGWLGGGGGTRCALQIWEMQEIWGGRAGWCGIWGASRKNLQFFSATKAELKSFAGFPEKAKAHIQCPQITSNIIEFYHREP